MSFIDERIAQEGLTFDDVLLVPAYSEVLPREVSLHTRFSRNICLNIPVVSAAMDTVTEAPMAIALAREGGIGVIHKNMSIAAQAAEVRKVKRSENGMISDPVTINQDQNVGDALRLMRENHIGGIPVTDGERHLVGIVTNRDVRFFDDLSVPVRAVTHFISDTAWPATADPRPDAAYYESIKDTKLADFPQKSYRVPVGSTHYLFDKEKKQFYYVKNYNTSAVGDATGFTVESYYYPPELLYFGNSPLRISNQEHKPEGYPDGVANWDDDKNWDTSSWTKNSHVTSATQSVAMVNDINYGTSLLKTTVSFGSSILRDNNHAIQHDKDPTITEEDEPDKRITADAGLFQLNGVLIGGQWKQVGWNFLPKGDKQGYVYDCDIASPDIPTSTPNYTLVFDNYNALMAKQDKVYVALELINNGEMFFGEHGMIPHGGIFYLIGELDPNKAGLEKPTWPQHHPLPPYNADGSSIETARVFMQDYMTTANFVIGENSLKHAYMTVPDLRYSALTLGMSVDINWSTGIDFGDVILGGDGANNTGN